MLTLFESVTYLFVPAGARIPYCGSVTAWAARLFEIKTGVGLVVFPKSITAPLKQTLGLLFERRHGLSHVSQKTTRQIGLGHRQRKAR